jgi:hypothetical protein
MDSLIYKLNQSSLKDHNEGDVQIIIYNERYDIINTIYAYKHVLEISPAIKLWFEKLEFYQDYVEIINNLILYNKADEYSYSLIIHGNNGLFDKYNTYLIKDILEYLEGKRNVYYSNELIECLKLLQVI